MPKTKAKKKSAKPKKTAIKKAKRPAKTARKKLTKKRAMPAKKKGDAKKKAAPKKKTAGANAMSAKAVVKKPVASVTSMTRRSSAVEEQNLDLESLGLRGRRSASAVQSGDLQGISHVEDADSESVEELIEEGNAFEADIVSGVERAGDDDAQEVRTREVPEDDVPSEYLDEE
jgi:hypothetical protein